ncbi:MAG: Lrp/AsnC family transcriptional regulator [Oceanospirillaceae bacterium]|nr:Lrp/AsnC family transcriptional regulator [Oceanospirillaceae bacterium]
MKKALQSNYNRRLLLHLDIQRNKLPMKLDSLDLAILDQLQKDARLSNQELAEKVGLSPSPCWRRVKRLEEIGVIKEYVALLAPKEIGVPVLAYAQVSLNDHRPESSERFDEFVRSSAQILECCSVSGEYDYLLKIACGSMEAYETYISRELLRQTDIRSMNTSFVLNQKKSTTALPL